MRLLQLRILLWKNLTLKIRNPWVLLFELFIPLILFLILLCIRWKQPAYPMPDYHADAKPLPSAGVIAVMQAFCDEKKQDERGFYEFDNSSVKQFLENFQQIAEHNNFFDPGFSPSDLDHIPDLYHRIIDDPAMLHNKIAHAQGIPLDGFFNSSQLIDDLVRNLSLPRKGLQALLSTSINFTELYNLLDGLSPLIPLLKQLDLKDVFPKEILPRAQSTSSLETEQRLKQRTNRHRRDLDLNYLKQQFGSTLDEASGTDDIWNSLQLTKDKLKQDALKAILNNIKNVAALPSGEFYTKLLWKIIKNNPQLLMDPQFRRIVMKLLMPGGRSGLDLLLSEDRKDFIDVLMKLLLSKQSLQELLCSEDKFSHILITPNKTTAADLRQVEAVLCNMSSAQWNEFSQKLINNFNSEDIIQKLSLQGATLTDSLQRLRDFESNLERFIMFERNLIVLGEFSSRLPQNACGIDAHHETTTLMDQLKHFTDGPVKEKSSDKSPSNKTSPNAGLFHIWLAMQETMCGKRMTQQNLAKLETSKDATLDSFGLSEKQRRNLAILIQMLYNNPRVLYAPNNSAVDDVIRKSNESFALIDLLSSYAKKWRNVSTEIRQYLMINTTEENLNFIRQMRQELQKKPALLGLIRNGDVRSFLGQQDSRLTINRSDLLSQLKLVDNAACSWLTLIKGVNIVNVFQGFSSEEELVKYFLNNAYKDGVMVLASIVFTNLNPDGSLPPHVEYKIRQNASFTSSTKSVRDKYWHPGPSDNPFGGFESYYQFGFVWVQDVIERAIINVQTGRDVVEPGTFLHQIPYPCYMEDKFLFMIEHVMPLCLTISWVYTVAMLVQSIVYEKEQRLKEVMQMMGLTNGMHWLAWFLTTFTQMSITMALLTIILKFGSILIYSNAFLIFFVLEVFTIATICFSFLVSACYSKAKIAAACAGIVYFLSYVPYMYIAIREVGAGDRISAFVKSVASLLSTTAFGLGAKYFALYEIEGVGVQWDNLSVSPVEDDQYNLLLVLLMMIIDALLYGLLTWYIENVHPGSYGLPKPWYFPFLKSYWCGGAHHIGHVVEGCQDGVLPCWRRGYQELSVVEEDQACAMDHTQRGPESSFETEPQHLTCGVQINNLSKIYAKDKVAVNKLNLNLYEGQITSFLGHNGAGKTTTMSILTGLFPPTSGSASVYGLDIRSDMEEIRKTLGMCPQHNVLFDKLTVEEHLWLYARLKGLPAVAIADEMNRMIEDLGLEKKRHVAVSCLSGGMKRKLSVAIAFVAGSRTVILDEPTAGVDPYARRAIWDLLLKYKQGRTILLSTHHMDEADILGDRIAIISNGQLMCCGTSMFLKGLYGEGFHLVLVKARSDEDLQSTDTLTLEESCVGARSPFHSRCCEEKVTAFIHQHIKTASLKQETSQELHYVIPLGESMKGHFAGLLRELDESMSDLKLSSYGVLDSSLEEVFLKVTEGAETQNNVDVNSGTVKKTDLLNQTTSPDTHDLAQPGGQVLKDTKDATSQHSLLLMGSNDVELDSLIRTSSHVTHFGHHRRSVSMESTRDLPMFVPPSCERESRRLGGSMVSDDDDDLPLLMEEDEKDNGVGSGRESHPIRDGRSDNTSLDGRGLHLLTGYKLFLQQFHAILIKRCYYTRRNWKGLFSQILLPALFVCIAMTVALTAPHVQDLPPIVLTPAQYYNYTQPQGNIVPLAHFENDEKHKSKGLDTESDELLNEKWNTDASTAALVRTFYLPSGLGATCVLKTPFNSSFDFDVLLSRLNDTRQNFPLIKDYFDDSCQSVFVGSQPLMNFVPPVSVAMQPLAVAQNKSSHSSNATIPSSRVKYHPDCACSSDHTGQVCAKDGYLPPERFQVVTGDHLLDITGDDEEMYYLRTADMHRLHRYGGYTLGLISDAVPSSFGQNGPSLFRKLAVRRLSLVWFDSKGYHSMPVYLNALNNAILRANLPKSKGNPAAYGITAINHPMNNTNNQLSLEYIKQGTDVIIAIFIICAMSFVPASFVLFLVHEQSIKAKHLQIVSGLNRVIYWLANYVWDMFNYVIPSACCIIILKSFDIPAYVSSTNFPCVIILFLLYGWSITPMMYPASFFFKEPSTAYICLIVINLYIGITCILTSFLFELFQQNSRDLANIHDALKNIFLLFPNYCLGRGLMDVAFNEYQNEFYFKTGRYGQMKSPFEWKITSRNIASMAATGFIFFFITLLCEFRFFIKSKHASVENIVSPVEEDLDVAEERRRVLRGSGKRDLLRLQNLTKVYKTNNRQSNQLAVDRLCLGVPVGECFGLLGVNGAGKTTTFKLLTGDERPTGGDAIIDGHSVVKSVYKAQQKIGYCPQFDSLYDELTAREHLILYARLRGIPPAHQTQVAEWALKKLCLAEYADRTSGTYSGGNKRKLSTAIALLGHPAIIFLDEPTTGMDPHSRRFLWDLILDLVQDGRSVILTSHSMEECETLCTRLAVMVNGRLHCLGSAQHLKNKYGDGYTMTLRVTGTDIHEEVQHVQRFLSSRFPLAKFKESHHNVLLYEFPSARLSLADVFACMEEACQCLPIKDYSISQNTLDNVFINFVKKQQEIVEESNELCAQSDAQIEALPVSDECATEGRHEVERNLLSHEDVTQLSDDDHVMDSWLTNYNQSQLSFLSLDTVNT